LVALFIGGFWAQVRERKMTFGLFLVSRGCGGGEGAETLPISSQTSRLDSWEEELSVSHAG